MPPTPQKKLHRVNASTPDSVRKSIQILLTQGDGHEVLHWLKEQPRVPPDMVQYVWMQSIRGNQTRLLFPWLREHHGTQLEELNKSMDAVKLLSSPRAWSALKRENLQPSLTPQEVVQIAGLWNKNLEKTSNNFGVRKNTDNFRAYFQEASDIQIDFLDHYVPSYKTKMDLLDIAMNGTRYSMYIRRIEFSGYLGEASALAITRATSMAKAANPDMWLLSCMEQKKPGLAYRIACQPTISTWWDPLLSEMYPKEFANDAWQRCGTKTSPTERPVPEAIVLALQLSAGTHDKQEQLSAMLAIADIPPATSFEKIDLSMLTFDME